MNQIHPPVLHPVILSRAEPAILSSAAHAQPSVILSEAKDLMLAGPFARLRNAFSALPFLFLLLMSVTLSASAQTLTGTVKNSTTGKPAAGDEIILITLGNGMEEAGRTKADAKGNFSFKLAQQGPHLVRVI